MEENDVFCINAFSCPKHDERVIIDLDKLLAALDYGKKEIKKETKKDPEVHPRSL